MFAAFMLMLATGAVPAVDPAAEPAKEKDPIICESSQEVGSLLRKKRICHRKSEWRELRAQDRQLINRTQVQIPINGGG